MGGIEGTNIPAQSMSKELGSPSTFSCLSIAISYIAFPLRSDANCSLSAELKLLPLMQRTVMQTGAPYAFSGRLHLDGSAGDEEPFVVYAVNWCGSQIFIGLDADGARLNTISGMGDGHIGPIQQSVECPVEKR